MLQLGNSDRGGRPGRDGCRCVGQQILVFKRIKIITSVVTVVVQFSCEYLVAVKLRSHGSDGSDDKWWVEATSGGG